MPEKVTYPHFPTSNWWEIRSQFIKSLPSTVTVSYLKTLLKLSSEKSAQNLIPPLKQLGLIDEECKPTARANEWRSDSKYKETCQKMAEEIYPRELLDLFPGPDFDRDSISDWFMNSSSLGKPTAKYCTGIYILLKQGDLISDEERGGKKPKKTNANRDRNSAIEKDDVSDNKKNDTLDVKRTKPPQKVNNDNNFSSSIHIDLQIHISPEASSEQIENIFSNISKYLKK